MTRWTNIGALGILLAALAMTVAAFPALAGEETAELDGKTAFVEVGKCNMCHAVPAAGIEAKAKSEAMKGPAIESLPEGLDLAVLKQYLRKEVPLNEKNHKKEFKGSDEELQAIVDWLGSLEAQK